MANLFLYLEPSFPERVSWAEQPDYGSPVSGSGSLAEGAAFLAGREAVVIVPGTDVLHTLVTVPRHHHRHLLESIPFMLEEYLAEDIDQLHFATGPTDRDGLTPVAVVSREMLASWLAALKENGIEPARLVPAGLAVPISPEQFSLVLAEDLFLLRKGPWQTWAGDLADLGRYLNGGGEAGPAAVRLFTDREDPASLVLPAGSTVTETVRQGLIETFCDGHDADTSIDLLQGEYSRRAFWREIWNKWRLPLSGAALVLALFLSSSLLEYSALSSAASDLDQQIQGIYLKTFPDSRRVVNPRAQMEQKLRELQKKAGGGGTFFALYDKTTGPLAKAPGFALNVLRFKDGRFDFDLQLSDLQTLDRLKQQLSATPGLDVEIRDAESSGGQVKARVQISEAGQ